MASVTLHIDTELVAKFLFYAGIVLLKTIIMTLWTVRYRLPRKEWFLLWCLFPLKKVTLIHKRLECTEPVRLLVYLSPLMSNPLQVRRHIRFFMWTTLETPVEIPLETPSLTVPERQPETFVTGIHSQLGELMCGIKCMLPKRHNKILLRLGFDPRLKSEVNRHNHWAIEAHKSEISNWSYN